MALQWPPVHQGLGPGLLVAAWPSGLSSIPHSPTHVAMGTRNWCKPRKSTKAT